MSASLYELTEDLVALDRLLTELGGEVTEGMQGQTLEAWADEFQWKMRDKVDGYGALIKNIEADVGVIDAEVKRLRDRSRILENRITRLKALAKYSMERLGTRKLEGQRFTIALQKVGGLDPLEILVEAKDLPEQYRDVETVYSANQDRIRAALQAKAPDIQGLARLGERAESVRIR